MIAGVVIILVGFLLTITIIGAIIGIPLLIIGGIVFILGLFLSPVERQQIIIQQHVGDTHSHKK